MLFCQTTLQESKAILSILKYFMEAFGTVIKNDKLNVYFFNTHVVYHRFLSHTMGFKLGTLPMKYL